MSLYPASSILEGRATCWAQCMKDQMLVQISIYEVKHTVQDPLPFLCCCHDTTGTVLHHHRHALTEPISFTKVSALVCSCIHACLVYLSHCLWAGQGDRTDGSAVIKTVAVNSAGWTRMWKWVKGFSSIQKQPLWIQSVWWHSIVAWEEHLPQTQWDPCSSVTNHY